MDAVGSIREVLGRNTVDLEKLEEDIDTTDGRLDSIRDVLSGGDFHLDKVEDDHGIFECVDAFIKLSRDNQTVEEVTLWIPFINPDDDASGTHRYAIWDKIAEGIGNLQALSDIIIANRDDEEDPPVPDWEILACILRRLRRGVQLRMWHADAQLWDTEALQVFARVIHGQAMITGFSTGGGFPFHCLDILCSALLTLPALENISFKHHDGEGPAEGQSLESMVKLLHSPMLRHVSFEFVIFTNTLSQAVARALKERSEITDLRFLHCSFPEGANLVIASVLKTNTTLECLEFDAPADEFFYDVLAAALLSNSTLQVLSLDGSGKCSRLSPLFLALQVNNGLKGLTIHGIELINEKLSTAIRAGLGRNSMLESLHLSKVKLGDNDTCLWREAFSFLRTNTAIETLEMCFEHNVTESHAATIRMEVLAMLCANKVLETLFMPTTDARFEDYLVCVAAVKSNTTLKRLRLHPLNEEDLCLDGDEMKDLIPVLKKNYGLEEFAGLRHGAGDVNSILQLNRAGRRYLVQDGTSISKGVDVLTRVNDDTNSVFFHLLENPRLCDRSAVENARSTSPGKYSGGKREQRTPSHPGKEPRLE